MFTKVLELLDFVERDYSQYGWTLQLVNRKLRHFDIYYMDNNVTADQMIDAVEKVSGPGKLLSYICAHDLVHAVMQEVDPEGLEERCVGPGKRKGRGHI
jgi:hypothetical protein